MNKFASYYNILGGLFFCVLTFQNIMSQEIKLTSQNLTSNIQVPEGFLTPELVEFLNQSRQVEKQYSQKGIDFLLQNKIFIIDNVKESETSQNFLLRLNFEKHKIKAEKDTDSPQFQTYLTDVTLVRNPTESLSRSDLCISMEFSLEGFLNGFTLTKGTAPPFSFFVRYYTSDKKVDRIIVTHYEESYCHNIHWDKNGRIITNIIDPFLGSPLWEKQEQQKQKKKGVQ